MENCVSGIQDNKLLLLELGVGDMTPSVIKLPFWDMTSKLPDTFLITVNLAKTSTPKHLEGKCMTVCDDLSIFLQELKNKCIEK